MQAPSGPDAERPIGRFIADHVLPHWEDLNEYPVLSAHKAFVTRQLERKGFTVDFMPRIGRVFRKGTTVYGGGFNTLTTLISDQAYEAASSRTLSRTYLAAAHVPLPRHEVFSAQAKDRAAEYVRKAGTPCVVKPDTGKRGTRTTFNVTAGDVFDRAWAQIAEDPNGSVIVEEQYDFLPVRVFLVGGTARAATVRVPLFVVGDGRQTVGDLLHATLSHRSRNRSFKAAVPETSSDLITRPGASWEEVPAAGSLKILSDLPTLAHGMLPVDVTDSITSDVLALSESAAASIPGLGSGGIDLLAPSMDDSSGAVVIGVDAEADMRMHAYPELGRRRGIGRHVADQFRLRSEYWDQPEHTPLLDWDELE